jgi:hypothetical protein
MNTVSLGEIVDEIIQERGEPNRNNFYRYLGFAISAYREIHWDVAGYPIHKEVTLNENDQLYIPEDAVNILAVGYADSRNNFIELSPGQSDMPMFTSIDDCGQGQLSGANSRVALTNSVYSTLQVNRYLQDTGGRHGSTGGNVAGSFKIDPHRRVINISSASSRRNKYTIVYLSNLRVVDGKIMVHEFAREPIKAGVRWISRRDRSSTSEAESLRLAMAFENQVNNMALRMQPMTKKQAMHRAMRGQKASKF